MKTLLDNVKYDIKLMLLTKSFFVLTIVMICIFMLAQYNQINKLNASVEQYIISYNEVVSDGENPEEMLKAEYSVEEKIDSKGGVYQYINNILRYDFENMKSIRADMEGINIVVLLLKNTILVFLSICVSIYMIYISCFEVYEKTLKTRLLMGSFNIIALSKFITGIILVTIAFLVSLISSSVISYIWIMFAMQNYPINYVADGISVGKLVSVMFISYIVVLLYSLFGYALGMIIRKISIVISVFLILHLIVPSFGKYDYKNLMLTLYDYVFGDVRKIGVHFISGVNIVVAIVILLFYGIILLSLGQIKYRFDKKNGRLV